MALSETTPRRHNCRWSHDEKQRLFDLYEQQRLDTSQIAYALDRSETAVEGRMNGMKKSGEWSRLQPRQMWSDGDVAALLYANIMRPDKPMTESLPSYHATEIERRWRGIYPSVLARVQHQESAMGTETRSAWATTINDTALPVHGIEEALGQSEGPSFMMMTTTHPYNAEQAGQLRAPALRDYQHEDASGLLPVVQDQRYIGLAGRLN